MMTMNHAYVWFAIVLGSVAGVQGQTEESATQPVSLKIATREVPPFVMKTEEGAWQGISIDLWNAIGTELGVTWEYEEAELDEMLDGVASGEFDAAVAALTMTAEREVRMDFSHPFYNSGLGIAVPGKPASGWSRIVSRIFSLEFAQAVAALGALLLGLGFLVWVFERRRNADQFGGSVSKGVLSGFWWSAVTMTTVGYGDKAPVTAGGRLVALVWMFASIIIISGFTAAIASALTVSQLATGIQGPDDLPGKRIGTVVDSTSAAYLRGKGARLKSYTTPAEALDALAAGEVEAVVYDKPILSYLVNNVIDADLRVLPGLFDPQNYAFALPTDSPLREEINRLILEQLGEPGWKDIQYRYLGE